MINWNMIEQRSSKAESNPNHHGTLLWKVSNRINYRLSMRPIAPGNIFNAKAVSVGFTSDKIFISTDIKGTKLFVSGTKVSRSVNSRDFVKNAIERLVGRFDMDVDQKIRVTFIEAGHDIWEIVKYDR